MLKVGSKLEAKHSENLTDYVTKGNIYEVVDTVPKSGFYIINDRGEKCFPISTTFKRIQ